MTTIKLKQVTYWGETRYQFLEGENEQVIAYRRITGNTNMTPSLKTEFERLGLKFEIIA